MPLNLDGLKCDNPLCDWIDETIPVAEFKDWVDKPCPKCGQNVLIQEDYNNIQHIVDVFTNMDEIGQEIVLNLAEMLNSKVE